MCVPTDRDDAIIPFADIFATTTPQPLPPRRTSPTPPPRRNRIHLLQAAPEPATSEPPTPLVANHHHYEHESSVHLIRSFADVAEWHHRCTCPDCNSRHHRHHHHHYHRYPCGQTTAMRRHRPGPVTAGVMLSTRLFVTISIALVAVKLIADFVVVPAGAVSAVRPAVADLYKSPSLTGVSDRGGRAKRQLPPLEQGNQVIDSIFQIPIGTLNAVGSLIKNARPLVRRTRERIQQYYSGQQQPSGVSQQQQQQQQYYFYGSRPTPIQASTSAYANRPYYTSYFNNNNYNRRKQQRDDPLPQGRHHQHGDGDDY